MLQLERYIQILHTVTTQKVTAEQLPFVLEFNIVNSLLSHFRSLYVIFFYLVSFRFGSVHSCCQKFKRGVKQYQDANNMFIY